MTAANLVIPVYAWNLCPYTNKREVNRLLSLICKHTPQPCLAADHCATSFARSKSRLHPPLTHVASSITTARDCNPDVNGD
jgi:hypothetical protein